MAYCGLMIAPGVVDCGKRRLSFARHWSICRHHAASAARSGSALVVQSHAAISASSARPASPTIGTSTGTFLLIDGRSRYRRGFSCECGLNAASLPVTRSSNRAPIFIITSQPCIARLDS